MSEQVRALRGRPGVLLAAVGLTLAACGGAGGAGGAAGSPTPVAAGGSGAGGTGGATPGTAATPTGRGGGGSGGIPIAEAGTLRGDFGITVTSTWDGADPQQDTVRGSEGLEVSLDDLVLTSTGTSDTIVGYRATGGHWTVEGDREDTNHAGDCVLTSTTTTAMAGTIPDGAVSLTIDLTQGTYLLDVALTGGSGSILTEYGPNCDGQTPDAIESSATFFFGLATEGALQGSTVRLDSIGNVDCSAAGNGRMFQVASGTCTEQDVWVGSLAP